MVTVTKRFSFCYGHHLPDYNGKCANVHGHNAELEVEVAGCAGDYPSMVMDFNALKATVNPVLEKLDHKDLNVVLPGWSQPPTAENMVVYIAGEIAQNLPRGVDLLRVSVSETPTSWAHWRK